MTTRPPVGPPADLVAVSCAGLRGRLAIGTQQVRQKLGFAPRHPGAPLADRG